MMLTETEENYLKAVFYLCKKDGDTASTNDIAARLHTKAASVTDMVKKLAEKELLIYEKYKGAKLSEKGKKIALFLVRKHRLWEVFLVDKLGFKWNEVHEVAEQLEHIKSKDLVARLDQFLNFPKIDPHGDPIPDKDGNFEKVDLKKLSFFNEQDKVALMGVADTSDDFLQYLNQLNLSLGDVVILTKKIKYDASFELQVKDSKLVISNIVANNLLVRKVNE